MKQTVTILSAMPYSIKDEASGRVNEGISIQYADTDEITIPCVSGDGILGYKVMKGSVSASCLSNLAQVPGVYEVDFRIGTYKDKTVLKPESLAFVSSYA